MHNEEIKKTVAQFKHAHRKYSTLLKGIPDLILSEGYEAAQARMLYAKARYLELEQEAHNLNNLLNKKKISIKPKSTVIF
jgi:hypothetical protein